MEYLPYASILLELVAAIFATIHFKKYAISNEKYFLHFLWYTFSIDTLGSILNYFSIDNSWLFNIFTVTSFLFYFYWYYTILKSKKLRIITIAATLFFLGMTLLTYIVPQLAGQGYAFVAGSFGLLILTVFNHYQLLKGDEVLILKYKLSFWISTALLLFYMGLIPFALLSKYLDLNEMTGSVILLCLNVILYGCYVIGFIWTKQRYNRF